jgi:hypothetical protein
MDLTSVCVMMDTSDLEMFVLVSQIILMDLSFRFRFMVFNTTFNNISVILWRSILLVGKKKGPGTVSGGWIYEPYTVPIILGRGTFPLELEPSWS